MPFGSPETDDCCHTSVASVSGSLSELYVHSPSTSPFSPSPLPTFDLPAHSNMVTMDVGQHSRLPALSSSRSHNADPNLYPATRRPSVSHLEVSSLNTTPTSINVSCPNLRAPDLALLPPSHSPADSKKSVRFSLEPSTVHITVNGLDKSEPTPCPKKKRQLLKTVVKVGVCVLFLAILLAVFAIESQNIANRHRKEAANDTDEQPDDSGDNDDDSEIKERNSNRMQRYMTTKLPYYSADVNIARKR